MLTRKQINAIKSEGKRPTTGMNLPIRDIIPIMMRINGTMRDINKLVTEYAENKNHKLPIVNIVSKIIIPIIIGSPPLSFHFFFIIYSPIISR